MKKYTQHPLLLACLTCGFVMNISIAVGQVTSIMPNLTEVTVRTFIGDTAIFAKANGIPAFIADEDQDISAVLEYMQILPYQFAMYNDLSENATLKPGAVYYLRPKENRSEVLFHYKRPGETLWDISQIYGVKLDKLLKKNRANSDYDVVDGQKIYLRKKRKRSENINVNADVTNLEPIDPWYPIKQRFLIDYSESESGPEGKLITNESNTKNKSYAQQQSMEDGIHVVQQEESVFSVSRKYGITVLDLLEWNQLSIDDEVSQGTTLFVANPRGKQAAAPQSIAMDQQDTQNEEQTIIINDNDGPIQNMDRWAIAIEGTDNNMAALSPEMIKTLEHKAKKGDYVYKLSDVYEVMPQDIIRWNRLKGKAWLYVDDKVIIKKIEGLEQNPRVHNVRTGETLYQISGIYDAKIKDLTAWNNLEDYTIYPGQDLIVSIEGFIPATPDTSTNNIEADSTKRVDFKELAKQENTSEELISNQVKIDASFKYHTVKEGEDIYQIAAKYGQTIQNLRKWNEISYGQSLTKGQILKVGKAEGKNLE